MPSTPSGPLTDEDSPIRLGIDLGGTKTELIALDDGGLEIVRKRVTPPSKGYDAIIATIARLVTEAEAALDCHCTVGIGIPGMISARAALERYANRLARSLAR